MVLSVQTGIAVEVKKKTPPLLELDLHSVMFTVV